MGYDVMAAWDRTSFEFNDHIQQRFVRQLSRQPRHLI